MTDDLVKRLREEADCYKGKTWECLWMAADRIERLEAANLKQSLITADHLSRIEQLETALLNIIATFGYGSSGGAYKNRYFNCLEIAKAELKHLGLKGQYSNYVKYVDDRKALEGKDG